MEKKYFVAVNEIGTFWYSDEAMTIFHRENGPAVEYADGDKYWYQNGKLHRLDGPAGEYIDGSKSWWQNGKLHRLDGPAVEYADGYVEYYIEGIELSEQEFLTRTQAQAPTCENKIVTIDGVDYKLVKA